MIYSRGEEESQGESVREIYARKLYINLLESGFLYEPTERYNQSNRLAFFIGYEIISSLSRKYFVHNWNRIHYWMQPNRSRRGLHQLPNMFG